jgi:hypothetical protein
MESNKITIARGLLPLAAMLAMLTFVIPALSITPNKECEPCNDAIKDFKSQNTDTQPMLNYLVRQRSLNTSKSYSFALF